ncbi:MAG: hypothetical protein ACN6RG_15290 [Stenotrophomonas sp.]
MRISVAATIFFCCFSLSAAAQDAVNGPLRGDIAKAVGFDISRRTENALPVLSAWVEVIDARALDYDCSARLDDLVECVVTGSFQGVLSLNGSATSAEPRTFVVKKALRFRKVEAAWAFIDAEDIQSPPGKG